MRDAKLVIDRLGLASVESPDPFSALVLTNFSFHYGSAAPKPELGVIVPKYPCLPLDLNLIDVLMEILDRYSSIPNEI